MKILVLSNYSEPIDGWASVGYYLAREFGKQHDVVLLAAGDRGIQYTSMTRSFFSVQRDLRRLEIVDDENFDFVFCGVEPLLPLAVALKRRNKGTRVVFLGQGTYAFVPFVKWPDRYWNRTLMSSVDHFVVPSAFTRAMVRRWWTGPVSVINYGVDCERYHRVDVPVERAFVSVGAQKERKGTHILLRAISILRQNYEVKLYFVGAKNPEFENMAAALGLSGTAIFCGHVDHATLLHLYSRSLCHVLPSINSDHSFEGFGLVHLEANACGLPSIGSRGTANEEVIVDGKTGFLCAQGDVGELVEKMSVFLKADAPLDQFRNASLQHAQSFSWSKTAAAILHLVAS